MKRILALVMALIMMLAFAACTPSGEGPENSDPVGGSAPVEETDPVGETDPVEESDPVEETPPVEETDPVEETPPAVETDPVEETPPAGESDPVEETPPAVETDPVEEPAGEKVVFHIQTDTFSDEYGRWLVDFGVGDFKEATDADVTFMDSKGWFEGAALSMLAKPNADYNLFWQVYPEGAYAVDTGLDPATTKLTLWVYVEDVEEFYESSWTEVDIGSGGWFGEEWACWQLKDEWINEGWNYLEFKLSEADENTGVDLSRLRWFRFCFVGAEEGDEFRIGDVNLISDAPTA